jgi:dihydroorotase
MTITYYEALGVAPDATTDEIRHAYRETMKLLHPDVGGRAAQVRMFTEARDTLCDPVKRKAYDARLAAGPASRRPTTDNAAPPGAETLDGARRCLLPALVDPHVHLRTPGQEHKEDLDSGTRAAAAGGYCAVVAMPNTEPWIDNAPTLDALRDSAARRARIPVSFLAAVTRGGAGGELTDMAELTEHGALGFTDDGHPVSSARILRRALQYQRLCGGVIALHEEDRELACGGVIHEGEVAALLGLAGIPAVAESTAIARDAALAAYEGARIHVQHVTCAEALAEVEAARERGVSITAEATPHHLTLTDEALLGGLDTSLKMNPPLRTENDCRAVLDALRSGTLDCVATDHAPHAREEKEVPFEEAPMGTTGLETSFAALHTELVLPGELPLGTLVERMTAGGEPFGIPAPRILPGERANLTMVDLAACWQVGEAGYESRSANCCFSGRELTGRVLMTVADGEVAYGERSFALAAAP